MDMRKYLEEVKAELEARLQEQSLTEEDMADIEADVKDYRESLISDRRNEYAKEAERIRVKLDFIAEMLDDIEGS